ncbi:hypothetical protein D2T31_21570 [Sinirhodobacter populi]|uniref:ParB-like N-terminal domain-containing protein n=1 Tax=Paenirhodobacter populi TaxID=2306993 RepID=A0A443JZ33_9RHOB|nr:hypothetical protein D2T31_21570 [Sinirhodobacter populi]
MAKAVQKITLSRSCDIPFDRLVLSQANVRKIKADISIEELAEDIARRGLLQNLNVRALLDGDGNETGMFDVPAGGRRYQALALLVKQKRLAKNASVPCIMREGGSDILAEDDSLAENTQRAALHPLDQFRAFRTLREKGQTEEQIAATFFVPASVVKQRLASADFPDLVGNMFNALIQPLPIVAKASQHSAHSGRYLALALLKDRIERSVQRPEAGTHSDPLLNEEGSDLVDCGSPPRHQT